MIINANNSKIYEYKFKRYLLKIERKIYNERNMKNWKFIYIDEETISKSVAVTGKDIK